MSNVFISYARQDRSLAEGLARDLEGRGYRVWWDAELVGSDDFQDVILVALTKARAAVVIWSKASVKSHFVRDEARYALHYKKLVAVKEPGLEVLDIPFGFQGQHTDDVSNRDQIVRAIIKLGVTPVDKPGAGPQAAAPNTWDSVAKTRDEDVLLDWLERNPGHEKRHEAFQRLRHLMDADGTAAAKETPGRIARMSNLSAFISGLTFRLPSFQLATQSKWSSIGLSIGLVVLLNIGGDVAARLGIAMSAALQGAGWKKITADAFGNVLFCMALLLLIWFAKGRFSAWVGQRNFVAAWIVAPIIALQSGVLLVWAVVTGAGVVGMDWGGDVLQNWPFGAVRNFPGGLGGASIVFCAGVLLAAVYMVNKVTSAR
jgi:hypothetical protein